MAENVRLINPKILKTNPENPRLIFRQDELDALQDSIAKQGILVPLTVYQDGKNYFLLDGERRWRCSLKLGLVSVPVIIQPKPDKMQNLMMMFAIHNARKDWLPLPTAFKLQVLESEFTKRNKRKPTEIELSGIASISRGEVRRLKKLLALPQKLINELIVELEKPQSQQTITVDQVLEATKGAEALRKKSIIDEKEEVALRNTIIKKFKRKIINSTVDPRKLVKLANAVDRNEISTISAKSAINRLINNDDYSIDDMFNDTVEEVDFTHNVEQITLRLIEKLEYIKNKKYNASSSFQLLLEQLENSIIDFLKRN